MECQVVVSGRGVKVKDVKVAVSDKRQKNSNDDWNSAIERFNVGESKGTIEVSTVVEPMEGY